MTTILALESEHGVTIGFDSKVSYGWEHADLEQPKVFTNGELVFGCSGALLDANVIKYADLPALAPDNWDIDRWVTNELIPAITEALHNRNVPEYKNGKIETGGTYLAVVRGRVYRIAHDTSWTRHTGKHYAIGSGSEFALGALAAGASVREALDIAQQHDSATGHRMTVVQASELLEGIAA
jgi:ATP-dependent protease HslVU (ClpYQ) peptidase subunit